MHSTRKRRLLLGTLLTLVVLGVLLGIFLNPLAAWGTRRALDQLEGFSSDFQSVSLSLVPLRYELTGLKLFEEPPGREGPPLLHAERIQAQLSFLDLLRGRVISSVRIEKPKIAYVLRKAVKQEVEETREKLQPPFERLVRALESAPPSRVDRVELLDGELLIEDRREKELPTIRLHGMDLTLENLATNRPLSLGQATIIAMSATLQKTGQVSMFLSVDPLTLPPHFAGRFQVKGLELNDFHDLLKAKTGVDLPKGVFEMFASFKTEQGHLEGGIKPVLSGLDAKPAEKGLGARIKAALADITFDLFKSDKDEDPEGKEKVATIIPIRGDLSSPDIQVWPTLFGVIRNAFVEGLAGSFRNTPPAVAGEKQNILQQAAEALKPSGDTPRAQPVKE